MDLWVSVSGILLNMYQVVYKCFDLQLQIKEIKLLNNKTVDNNLIQI